MKKTVYYGKKAILWMIATVFLVLYLYSDIIFDNYQISFASHMYMVEPWSWDGVKYEGPRFTDIEDSEYPALYSIFKDGGFDGWNNKIGLGTTQSYDYILYPLNYLYKLPMEAAVGIKVTVEFFVAFLGIFLLMKQYKSSSLAAGIAGVTYMFSATMVVWLGWGHSDVAAFAPFAFLFADKLIQKVKLKYALMLAVTIFIMYVAGMPTFAAYFTYLLGFYVLFRTIRTYWADKKKIMIVYVLFGVGILLGVGLTLPYTISLVRSVGSNGYAESRGFQAYSSLNVEYMRTFIYPYFRNGLPKHINESTLYCGIMAVITLPLTFFNRKEKKQVYFYGLSTLILFLLIFTGVFNVIYTKMPMINTSFKYRNITTLMFTMSMLLGINIDDVLKNREYYRHKIYSLFIVFLWTVTVLSLASYKIVTLKDGVGKNIAYREYTDYSGYYKKAVYVALILVALFCLFVYGGKKIFLYLSLLVVIFDMTSFAREYFPLISKDATIIPKPTDTIQYLQEHTQNYERYVGIGEWKLMANSGVYYGVNDIRMHDFIATNPDIMEYYTSIYEDCYPSATRVSFERIDNFNLLRYLGVKYLVGNPVPNVQVYSSELNKYNTTELIPAGSEIKQEFVAQRSDIYNIRLLLGTLGTTYRTQGKLVASIMTDDEDTILGTAVLRYSDVKNDSFNDFQFHNVKLQKGETYILQINVPEGFEEALVFYKSELDEDDNWLTVNDNKIAGHMIMHVEYMDDDLERVYAGDDRMTVYKFSYYQPKVSLASHVFVEENDKKILRKMKKKYLASSVFVKKDDYDGDAADLPLEENEQVELETYENDYIKMKYTSNYKRYLVLNDYYNSDWKAYVNGKEVKIDKVNYLFRGIEVDAGQDVTVEMKYESGFQKKIVVIAIADFILIVILAVGDTIYSVRNKRQREKV